MGEIEKGLGDAQGCGTTSGPLPPANQEAVVPAASAASPVRRPLWRLPLCWMQLCGFKTNSDDGGIWGECVTCGKRAGYVSREDMRRYIDREITQDALLKAMESQHG